MADKKIQTTIMSDPSLKAMVEAYQEAIGARTYSMAANDLMIKGLENLETIKESIEIQKSENAKLRKQIKDTNERQIAFMEEILRFTAMSFGWAKLSAASTTGNGDYVKNVLLNLDNQNMEEGKMIKRAFKSLSEQKARKEEEDFFREV